MTSPDPKAQLRGALDELIQEGHMLVVRHLVSVATPEQRKNLAQQLLSESTSGDHKSAGAQKAAGARTAGTKTAGTKTENPFGDLSKIHFGNEYQPWYSKALRTVEQLLPDRYEEFRTLYRLDKRRGLDVESYGISDAIQGLTVSRMGLPAFDTGTVASTKLQQQVAILKSARDRLDSVLSDIRGVLEAGLFDQELAGSSELLKARHLRAAGIVAAIVLERHLKRLTQNHHVPMRKKATIANLNDALKDAGVLDVPRWRQIQHLADVRNLCAHSADRGPTKEEVDVLIRDVNSVVKTTF